MRCFIGFDIICHFPELPSPQLIAPQSRHLTLAFLGNLTPNEIGALIEQMPKPTFKVASCGIFDKPLSLPPAHPRVFAWHIRYLDNENILAYQRLLASFLNKVQQQEFLSHVTLSRHPPFTELLAAFIPLPMTTAHLHIYESLGHSQYKKIWTHQMLLPFEEFEHTGDLAFIVRGKDYFELFVHAFLAIAFEHPALIPYYTQKSPQDLQEVIICLNDLIAEFDIKEGAPFKAVSFHSKLEVKENLLIWEMIVDV